MKVILSRESLTWTAGEYPSLHAKGHETATVHRWLVSLTEDGVVTDGDLVDLIVHSNKFLTLCSGDRPFQLSLQEADEAFACGLKYLSGYVAKANKVAAGNKLSWFIRPKLHMFQHIVLSVKLRQSRRNPHQDTCWTRTSSAKQ